MVVNQTNLGAGKWARWQWQPITYGASASHDPSPPIILETSAPAVLLTRMVLGLGV